MFYPLLIFLLAIQTFESQPPESFRTLSTQDILFEFEPKSAAFISTELSRPVHFQTRSLYSSEKATIKFVPPVRAATLDVSPYRSGRPKWNCYLVQASNNVPYPYPITDTLSVAITYPDWAQLWANPGPNFRISHCIVSNLTTTDGLFLDNLYYLP